MASHKTVFYSPDRQYRITADPGGSVFTVERELSLVRRFRYLHELTDWLADQGISLDQLIED
jgi:hypothetical protein